VGPEELGPNRIEKRKNKEKQKKKKKKKEKQQEQELLGEHYGIAVPCFVGAAPMWWCCCRKHDCEKECRGKPELRQWWWFEEQVCSRNCRRKKRFWRCQAAVSPRRRRLPRRRLVQVREQWHGF
jgi:hypothetical protein